MSGEGLTFTGINLGPAAGAPPPPGPVPVGPSGSPYDDLINRAAQENNLDQVIFRKMLVQESGLNPNAVGPETRHGRAQGIAQFMPAISKSLGIDPMDPEQAIRASAKMMRGHLNANNESYPMALAAYNWGSGNLAQYGFDKRPPETRKYISNIMGPDSGSRTVVGLTPPPAVAAPPSFPGAMAMAPADQSLTFTGINLGPDPGQQPPQQRPLNAGLTFTGINLGPEASEQEAPPWYDLRDAPGSLVQGILDAVREGGQLAGGQAFTDQPQPQQPQPKRSFVGEAMYGVGHSSPMIATGLLGGLGGAAVGGPLGAMAGTALGIGGTSALQALVPGYREGRQQGMEHDQAVDYAIRRASTEGVIGAATAPIFGLLELAPVKSAVAKWLLANAVAQPAVGVTTRVVEPMVTGDKPPTAEELLRGAGQDIIAGATFSAGHALANRFLPKRETPPSSDASGLRQLIENMRAQLQQQQQAEPGPAVPAAAVQQHVATRRAALKDATTPDEITEREFITKYANDPAALAQLYGVTIAPDEPLPSAPAQGEPVREPVPATAETPRAAAAAPEAGVGSVLADVSGERVLPARDAGDQGRDIRAAVLPGEGVSAERPSSDGNVRAPVEADRLVAPQEETALPVRAAMEDKALPQTGERAAEVKPETASRTSAPQIEEPLALIRRGELSADRAEATAKQVEAHVTDLQNRVFGANADEYRGLLRKIERPQSVDPGMERLNERDRIASRARAQELEAQAPPEALKQLHDVYDNAPEYFDAAYWRDLSRQLRDMEESRGAAVTIAARALERLPHGPPKFPHDQEAIALINHAMQTEADRGGDVSAFLKEVAARRYQEYGGGPDAREITDDQIERLKRLATGGPAPEDEPKPKSIGFNSRIKSQPDGEPRLGQAEGQAERLGQVGQAESSLSPESLQDKNLSARPVTSTLEDASAPEQGELFRDEQPVVPAAGETTPEEAPIDVKTAKRPQDQLRLNALNAQLDKLQAQPGDHEAQIAKLTATRDKLLPQDLLAKRQPPPKRPVNTAPPKALGAEKDFHDYKYQNGTPVYRDAFVEHAMRKMGMSQDQAEAWVDQGINLNVDEQVVILRDQVKDKFGFPDVALDPKVSDYDKRNFLLDFHRAAQDMMHALGLPVEMASLMGKVRLELNAIGKKTPYGSYTPSTKTIAVYGRANVFGHEWGHALDHEIADHLLQGQQNPGYLATQLGRAGVLNPANSMPQRIGHLINTMFHDKADLAAKRIALQIKAAEVNKAGTPTLAAQKAQAALKALETGTNIKGMKIAPSDYRTQAGKFGPAKYWANEAELLARSIEAYIARIMEQAGLDPRGMVLPDEAYLAHNDKRLRMTFPKQQERADIFAAIDHVMDGYRQTALAGSPRAAQAMRGGISDPKVYGRTAVSPNKMGPIKTLIHRIRNMNDTLSRTALTDPTRPDPGGNHVLKRTKNWASTTFNSRMGILEGMRELITSPRARAALQSVMDRLGHTVGSGHYTGWDTIEERAHTLSHKALSQYTNVMTRAGLEPERLTKEQGDHLRHVMTTGENTYPVDPLDPNSRRVPIDPKIIQAAGPLRSISDRFFQELKDAGIDIGYAKNGHFLRLYDQVRVHSDPNGFIKAASSLHKLMFDTEVGNAGDSPEKLYEQWTLLNSVQRKQADPSVISAMDALKQNLEQQRNVEYDMQMNGVTAAKQAQYLQLQKAAEQLAQQHHDTLGEYIADINAHTWLNNLRLNYAHDFEHNGPGGNFLNKRTLPPQADRIMRDYMITDPTTVLPRYYESAARKIAYAERFGGKNEIRKQLVQDMIDSGMHQDDYQLVEKIIDSVAGRTNNEHSRGLAKAANWIHAGAALGLLGRSAYSTLAEPFVIALSHGHMRAGLKSFGAVFGNIMRTGTALERAQLADFIGITTSAIQDDVIMNRVSADYSDSPMLGKFMSRYYRTIGLTQMTNWNRRAAMAGGDWLLNKYSRDILQRAQTSDARDTATRMLNELGIAPELHSEFAQWKLSLKGMPGIDQVEGARFGSVYARAMRRIVDRSVIDPKKIERPLSTDDKWMGLLFQFQSFNYGFQRNVLDPMMRRIGHAYERGAARGGVLGGGANAVWAATHTGSIVGAYVAVNMLTTAVRQFLFNRDDWDKHEADDTLGDYITDLAVQRSGLGGTLDPVTQLMTNLRYNQDLASILEGPGIKWIAKNGWDVLMGAADQIRGGQDETNTRPHEMVKGLYNLIGVPLEAIMAVKLSGFGTLANVAAGVGYQYLSSPQAAEDAATAVTGPKGAELPKETGGLPKLPKIAGLPKLPKIPKPGEQPDDEAGGEPGIVGSIPWGLADDFIAPLWKVTKPVVGMIPKRVKQAAAIGGAAYEGLGFWNRMEPYRNAPPPKQKESAR